jgi:hypothetical protein
VDTIWPALPYDAWRTTCDTLHAHTQLLGKLAAKFAPPEPYLQHAALRLTLRGWETLPLPAPDGSGAFGVALDLRTHHVVIEHSDGRNHRVPLTPDRSVGEVTRDVLDAVIRFVGPIALDLRPQETPWNTPLDEDTAHATYDTAHVNDYFVAATQAGLVLAALRAPYRGRSTPVNAWWGTFDLATSLFSGQQVEPASRGFIARNSANAQQIEIGWWPGDQRYPHPAFFAFAYPAVNGAENAIGLPASSHWNPELGEYILDWEDARAELDPKSTALEFGRAVLDHACAVCNWPPALAASAVGSRSPVE